MSAINVVRQPNQIIVATDSAAWNLEGVIVGFWPKLYAIPHMPAAIATRGACFTSPMLGWALSGYSTFDEMVDQIEDAMPGIHDRFRPHFEECQAADFDLIIAGFSKARDAFETYYMTTIAPSERGCTEEEMAKVMAEGGHLPDPYKLEKIEDAIFVSPHVFPDAAMKAGITELFDEEPQETVLRELTVVMELQRRSPFMFPGSTECFHAVGGSATATIVTRTGVEQFTFHRWPEDKVGELIQPPPTDWAEWRAARQAKPHVAEKSTDELINLQPRTVAKDEGDLEKSIPMNRQQRRYLERQQRKKRA